LDWYLREYTKTPDQYKKQCVKTSERNGLGIYKLSMNERKRILIHHIFGVDIDTQAVEVSKLSLLLKALEGLNEQEIQKELFNERVLPDLSRNIKCGNSLIGNDFYAQGTLDFSEDEQYKINAFDWKTEFADVFKDGGFDVVMGNPPYVNMANIEDESTRAYLQRSYKTAINKVDLYSLFTEKCVDLLKEKGIQGYIFSNSWLGTNSFIAFREMLVKKTKVLQLVKMPPNVFQGATVTTVLLFFQKEKVDLNHNIILKYCIDEKFEIFNHCLEYQRIFDSPNYAFGFNQDVPIKINCEKLVNVANFSLGIKTSDDKYFISDTQKNTEYYPLLRGKDVSKYSFVYQGKYVWYRPDLMAKRVGARPRILANFLTKKIIIKDVATSITATIDISNFLVTDTLNVIYHVEKYDMKFILALLNSLLINKWFKSKFEAGLHIKTNQLGEIPIPVLDLSKKSDKDKHDKLVGFVDQMLILKKKEQAETVPQTKTIIARQIQALDKQIDKLVYALYGLSEEEIKVVEGEKC
jgi:methylase of polypeptide subunit release factors